MNALRSIKKISEVKWSLEYLPEETTLITFLSNIYNQIPSWLLWKTWYAKLSLNSIVNVFANFDTTLNTCKVLQLSV